MADTKLTALTALGTSPATDDLLYLVDTSASESKSMTVTNLFTSPTFTTPTLGVATATSINGLTITTSTGTLTITNGKTLTLLKTMSFTSADDTGVYTFPTGTKTLLATNGSGASLTGIVYTITGTANQVIASASTGDITLSLPQSIATSSSPQFSTLELGHASDTTLSRLGAGVVGIEGNTIFTTAGGLMNGTMTLGENTSIALDPAGSADGKYSGITLIGVGGTTIAFGDLLSLSQADGRWEWMDISTGTASISDPSAFCAMAVSTATNGSPITVLLKGLVRADSRFPAFNRGKPVYASINGLVTGTATTTTDQFIRIVGHATSEDEMYFNPENNWMTRV